ncbi:DNA-directed DNA polymerase III alpha subunit [Liquorilactobacillus capillatus DSM 19910]|uniref:DNA-directed DNA polymerase n=2 Tax=Liquorilactobacillus capillatus TaxID=480931 RepID=A0A0R1M8Z0_9LACO|nr:DNA-directed DNA polymerase III alpha subunit [Liquorilactobacillus capillatus DSM 19910]
MYGAIEFYHECRSNGIKPIIGLTLDLGPEDQLLLLAKNEQGYRNLMHLSTQKMLALSKNEAQFKLNRPEELQDLAIIVPPQKSYVITAVSNGDLSRAQQYLERLATVVGKTQNIYLGINLQMEPVLLATLHQLAAKVQVTPLVLEPVKYLNPNDIFEMQVLEALRDGKQVDAKQLRSAGTVNGKEWLRPKRELESEYQQHQLSKDLAAMLQLCQELNPKLHFSAPQLPHFKTPAGEAAQNFLRKLCEDGLKKRLKETPHVIQSKYQQRLEYELSVIHRMKFDDYFLIVWDVTNYAHQTQIMTGPGRGSAAGSLVAYTLFITDVDPLEYDLLFERFLNEERAQMPDIDLDIPDNRRQEIIQYVHQKYGAEHVAQIITFGTLGAKQVLRDVGRVFGMPQFEMNRWSKTIPTTLHITLKEAYESSQRLRNLVTDSEKNRLLFKTAQGLEGLPRHFSIHAAGIILSDKNLADIIPLQMGNDELLLTQYTKETVEEVGLLKIDFLGLRNLSILARAVQLVHSGYQHELNVQHIALDDVETLRLFQTADTAGVFQFESTGIKSVLRRLRPSSFEDIAAVNALYRPGPMENIDLFIRRRHGLEKTTYPAEILKPILKKTYGVLVYQEQVMQVASVMGGFTLGQADLLRRAMSKKKAAVIEQMKTRFITGAKDKGFTLKNAEQVYAYIEKFANYGFNRSHAVAYTKMAFQLAYIKQHYPAAFFVALLNTVTGDNTKLKNYLLEAKQHHLKIHAPDVNESQLLFALQAQEIYLGLRNIKTIRSDFAKQIISERRLHGKYRSFQSFLQRIDNHFLQQEPLEALIYVGAFDKLGHNRATLLKNLPRMLSNVELSGNNIELFAALTPKYQTFAEISLEERLKNEEKYLGIYLSAHPVEQFSRLALLQNTTVIAKIAEQTGPLQLLVYIKKVKVIRTKTGQQMAFVTVEDQTGQIEMTVFTDLYKKTAELLTEKAVILVKGKSEQTKRGLQLIARELTLAQTLNVQNSATYYIRLTKETNQRIRRQMLELMLQYHGQIPVILFEETTAKKIVLSRRYWLKNDEKVITALSNLLGQENIVLTNENK